MPLIPLVPRRLRLCAACAVVALALATPQRLSAQAPLAGYTNYEACAAQMRALAQPGRVSVDSLGRTLGGRDVLLVTIADGPPESKPAVLLVGNVHAPHLVGSELAQRIAARLARPADDDAAARQLLERCTVYIIPRPAPDASEAFFRPPFFERNTNDAPTDDDRDGATDEDPPNDLNGDGWITQMRVADPAGRYIPHPQDPRVLIEADPKKNERGQFSLFSEGKDDDQDGQFNEDGAGGVAFDRNWTFRYPYFQPGAGPNAVSEIETRAVADFCFAHPNITVVFCFTPEDNLWEPWKPDAADQGNRIRTTVAAADADSLNFLAEQYRQIHGGKDAPPPPSGEGGFLHWAYFHYGRWALGARAWWIPNVPPAEGEKKEEPVKDAPPAPDKPKVDEKRGAEELNALRWFAGRQVAGFVDWTPIEHSDFPGRKVEVGGFKPYLRLNPPPEMLAELADKHVNFLCKLPQWWPQLELTSTKAEPLGGGLFRISVELVNTGLLPTMPAMGRHSRQQQQLQFKLTLPEGVSVVTGTPRVIVEPLAGRGGKKEQVWLVRRKGNEAANVSITAYSPTVGSVSATIELSAGSGSNNAQ